MTDFRPVQLSEERADTRNCGQSARGLAGQEGEWLSDSVIDLVHTRGVMCFRK